MPEAKGDMFMDMDVRQSDSTCVLAFHRVRCHQSIHPMPSLGFKGQTEKYLTYYDMLKPDQVQMLIHHVAVAAKAHKTADI